MILQKARLLEPVILMGETGSGKTYLVKYIAEVLFGLKSIFRSFIFHYGIDDLVFIEFMEKVIDDAKQQKESVFWVFFDEFNTSDLQPYVTELLNDRVFSLSDEPESKLETWVNF
jgi:MoxR-like ATPase